jgi:hypothetical protein
MNPIDQRLNTLAERARQAEWSAAEELPLGFATRVLALARADGASSDHDVSQLWYRCALTALPVAAIIAAGCWWWPLDENSSDPTDLAAIFVENHFLP